MDVVADLVGIVLDVSERTSDLRAERTGLRALKIPSLIRYGDSHPPIASRGDPDARSVREDA
jgi:hypothetical protein